MVIQFSNTCINKCPNTDSRFITYYHFLLNCLFSDCIYIHWYFFFTKRAWRQYVNWSDWTQPETQTVGLTWPSGSQRVTMGEGWVSLLYWGSVKCYFSAVSFSTWARQLYTEDVIRIRKADITVGLVFSVYIYIYIYIHTHKYWQIEYKCCNKHLGIFLHLVDMFEKYVYSLWALFH